MPASRRGPSGMYVTFRNASLQSSTKQSHRGELVLHLWQLLSLRESFFLVYLEIA